MTEFEIIQEEIESIRQKYLRSVMDTFLITITRIRRKRITNAVKYMNCSKMQMTAIRKNFRKYLFVWS